MASLGIITEEMADRRVKVELLMVRGWSQRAMARELGVSPTTIHRDVQAVRAEWKNWRPRDYETALSHELEKLSEIEREAWDAWERSKRDEVRNKVSRENDNNGDGENQSNSKRSGGKEKAERATASQSGDLRYLELIVKCVDRRCKMQGLDDPTEHLLRDTYCVAARELNDDELRALNRLRERLTNEEAQRN